jgi:hypothetical protein
MNVPPGASGSVTRRAILAVLCGTGAQERGGEISVPSQVYTTGICPSPEKASEETSRAGAPPLPPEMRHPEEIKRRTRVRCRAARAALSRTRVTSRSCFIAGTDGTSSR